MSIFEICSLFGIMVVLAAIPSTNVTLVVTRSITSGAGSGIAVAAGIVLGDLVFIMLAILGLSVVADSMGSLFMVTRYLGASYLLWLGFSLLKAQDKTTITVSKTREKSNLIASLIAGFDKWGQCNIKSWFLSDNTTLTPFIFPIIKIIML